jgi:hypothetical protein
MGWNRGGTRAIGQFLILSTQGGVRAAGRHAGGPGLPHRALGDRAAGASGGGRVAAARQDHPLRRVSARIPATAGRRGPPACSTACRFATTRRIVLRRLTRSLPLRSGVLGVATCDKGPAGDADGRGGAPSPALGGRAGRRHAAADERRGCGRACRRSARASRMAWSRWIGGGRPGLPGLRVARRRLPVSRHGGHRAGGQPRRWGFHAAARGAGPSRPAGVAGSWRCRSARAVVGHRGRGD